MCNLLNILEGYKIVVCDGRWVERHKTKGLSLGLGATALGMKMALEALLDF